MAVLSRDLSASIRAFLDDGDLRMTVDFRRVSATVLEGWLGLPAKEALGGAFEPLPILA